MPLSQLLVMAGNPWHFLACSSLTPISAPVTWPSSLCVCVSPPGILLSVCLALCLFSFHKDTSHWIKGLPYSGMT